MRIPYNVQSWYSKYNNLDKTDNNQNVFYITVYILNSTP